MTYYAITRDLAEYLGVELRDAADDTAALAQVNRIPAGLQHALVSRINGGMQELRHRGPRWLKTRHMRVKLNKPRTITLAGGTPSSVWLAEGAAIGAAHTAVTDTSILGCTVKIGDQYNIIEAIGTTLTLRFAHGADDVSFDASGEVEVTVYGDGYVFPADVVRADGNVLMGTINGTMHLPNLGFRANLHEAARTGQLGTPYGYWTEAHADRHIMRFAPWPDQDFTLEFEGAYTGEEWAQADLSKTTEGPSLPGAVTESTILPILRAALMTHPKFIYSDEQDLKAEMRDERERAYIQLARMSPNQGYTPSRLEEPIV